MIPTVTRSPYSHPDLREVVVIPDSKCLAATSLETKGTESITNDTTEHDWD